MVTVTGWDGLPPGSRCVISTNSVVIVAQPSHQQDESRAFQHLLHFKARAHRQQRQGGSRAVLRRRQVRQRNACGFVVVRCQQGHLGLFAPAPRPTPRREIEAEIGHGQKRCGDAKPEQPIVKQRAREIRQHRIAFGRGPVTDRVVERPGGKWLGDREAGDGFGATAKQAQ